MKFQSIKKLKNKQKLETLPSCWPVGGGTRAPAADHWCGWSLLPSTDFRASKVLPGPAQLCGVFFYELAQMLQISVSILKFNWVLFVPTGSKVDGGEPFDFVAVTGDIIGGGIHLGNDQVLVALVLLAQGSVHRLQLLAVPTPGCIELYEDVLLRVHHDGVEGLPHHDLDWPLVVLRHWLGFDDWLQFSCQGKQAGEGCE